MKYPRSLSFLVFISVMQVMVVGIHASLPSEEYWNSVLPHTPMPNAIRELLKPKGLKPMNLHPTACVGIHVRMDKFVEPTGNEAKIGNFFLETDLHPGKRMELSLATVTNGAVFLPHQVAESIPFSTNKMPEILSRFSLKESSVEAGIIKGEIEECEEAAMVGEDKYCAKSLESLVDFSTSKLGRDVNVEISDQVKEGSQEYEFGEGIKKVGDKSVVCHQMNYPYAIFYCHTLSKTTIYSVPVTGADGSEAKAMAACHGDTSTWHPRHVAFQVLKVKPGTIPICHFLHSNAMVWFPNI